MIVVVPEELTDLVRRQQPRIVRNRIAPVEVEHLQSRSSSHCQKFPRRSHVNIENALDRSRGHIRERALRGQVPRRANRIGRELWRTVRLPGICIEGLKRNGHMISSDQR